VNVGLIQQADLLVEGLDARIDDLGDGRLRLALLAELFGENVLLAVDEDRIETARIKCQRLGGLPRPSDTVLCT